VQLLTQKDGLFRQKRAGPKLLMLQSARYEKEEALMHDSAFEPEALFVFSIDRLIIPLLFAVSIIV
jgi:hypothetical protein